MSWLQLCFSRRWVELHRTAGILDETGSKQPNLGFSVSPLQRSSEKSPCNLTFLSTHVYTRTFAHKSSLKKWLAIACHDCGPMPGASRCLKSLVVHWKLRSSPRSPGGSPRGDGASPRGNVAQNLGKSCWNWPLGGDFDIFDPKTPDKLELGQGATTRARELTVKKAGMLNAYGLASGYGSLLYFWLEWNTA